MSKPYQLTETEIADLKAEMQSAGLRMRSKLKAMQAAKPAATVPAPTDITLPLPLPIYVTKERWPQEKPSRFD